MLGMFSRFRGGEAKAIDFSQDLINAVLGNGMSKAGVAVNETTALRVSTFLACARVISNGVAQIPLKVYQENDDGSKTLARDNPVYKLLARRPNDWMTSFEFRQLLTMHAVVRGNGYAFINRDNKKNPIELIPLCGKVVPTQDSDWNISYDVYDKNGFLMKAKQADILHLKNLSMDGISGMDVIGQTREALSLAIATEEAHSRLHANGVKPGGIISFERELSKEARARLRAAIKEDLASLQNAYKTLILDNSAKWQPFGMSGVDAQHIETRKHQIEEICRGAGVFPHMIGYSDKTTTFASADAFFQAHVTYSLEPWTVNWQQVIQRDLFRDEDGLVAEFSMQGLLRGDHQTRAAYYTSGIQNGYFSRNEVRKWENLNPVEGLDDMLVPLNMGTQAERAAAAKEIATVVKSMMGHNGDPDLDDELETKIGRVLSARNERRIVSARDQLDEVLRTMEKEPSDG